jgi:hypothetical protein
VEFYARAAGFHKVLANTVVRAMRDTKTVLRSCE